MRDSKIPVPFVRPALAPLFLLALTFSANTHGQSNPVRSEPRILSDKPDRTVVALEYLPETKDIQKAGGIGLYRVSEDSPGIYAQFLTDLDQERPRTIGNPSRFAEPNIRTFREVTLLNVGVTSRMSPNLTLLAGIGYASVTPVTEKNDVARRLSSTGRYFVEDTGRRENDINVQVGFQFNAESLAAGLTYNSAINAPHISFGYRF